MPVVYCALYISVVGFASLCIGNALPRRWFHPEAFPFRSFAWEREGKIYNHLGIRYWKDKLPDMSLLCANMVRKQVQGRPTVEVLEQQAVETCAAESVHVLLIPCSLPVLSLYPGLGGWVVYFMCVLGNFPFILIQRYNRPRFLRALEREREKSAVLEA